MECGEDYSIRSPSHIIACNNDYVVIESHPEFTEAEFERHKRREERLNRGRRISRQPTKYNTKYNCIAVHSLHPNDNFNVINDISLFSNFVAVKNWGFQIFGTQMAYVDKQNFVRIIDFTQKKRRFN